jgi:hypothetical protein
LIPITLGCRATSATSPGSSSTPLKRGGTWYRITGTGDASATAT